MRVSLFEAQPIVEFKEGKYTIEDGDKTTRQLTLDLAMLRNHFEADPYQIARELSACLGHLIQLLFVDRSQSAKSKNLVSGYLMH